MHRYFLVLLLLVGNCFAGDFQLQPGDLLFQDLNCGVLCNGISKVTWGYGNTNVSHNGMVVSVDGKEPMVIEANTPVVTMVPLSEFLARSHDASGNPRVMVGRLQYPYNLLIPEAIMISSSLLGRPYNHDFHPNGYSMYCSQLTDVAFKWANHGISIFKHHRMSFIDPHTGRMIPAWKGYFASLGMSAPEGLIGLNPGMLSRSPHIKIVHYYGEMSAATTRQA